MTLPKKSEKPHLGGLTRLIQKKKHTSHLFSFSQRALHL